MPAYFQIHAAHFGNVTDAYDQAVTWYGSTASLEDPEHDADGSSVFARGELERHPTWIRIDRGESIVVVQIGIPDLGDPNESHATATHLMRTYVHHAHPDVAFVTGEAGDDYGLTEPQVRGALANLIRIWPARFHWFDGTWQSKDGSAQQPDAG